MKLDFELTIEEMIAKAEVCREQAYDVRGEMAAPFMAEANYWLLLALLKRNTRLNSISDVHLT
jgi:hypothetical protein